VWLKEPSYQASLTILDPPCSTKFNHNIPQHGTNPSYHVCENIDPRLPKSKGHMIVRRNKQLSRDNPTHIRWAMIYEKRAYAIYLKLYHSFVTFSPGTNPSHTPWLGPSIGTNRITIIHSCNTETTCEL